MPGSGYSSTCLAPAPLWAEIRAKRSPGTQGGDPWAFGVEGGTSLLEQPVQCGRVSASSLGAAFLKAGNSLAWGAQPSLPLQMPRVSSASHPSTFENFQVASSLVKKIRVTVCALILQMPHAGAFPSVCYSFALLLHSWAGRSYSLGNCELAVLLLSSFTYSLSPGYCFYFCAVNVNQTEKM